MFRYVHKKSAPFFWTVRFNSGGVYIHIYDMVLSFYHTFVFSLLQRYEVCSSSAILKSGYFAVFGRHVSEGLVCGVKFSSPHTHLSCHFLSMAVQHGAIASYPMMCFRCALEKIHWWVPCARLPLWECGIFLDKHPFMFRMFVRNAPYFSNNENIEQKCYLLTDRRLCDFMRFFRTSCCLDFTFRACF